MSDKPESLTTQALNVIGLLVFLGAIAHVTGVLPQAWTLLRGAPGQIQQNVAALSPQKGAAALPDPSAPFLSTAEAAAPTDAPVVAVSPIAPPEAAKKDCKGAPLASLVPFTAPQYAKFKVIAGEEGAIKSGVRLADVMEAIGSPVCQLPTYTVKAGFPLDRYRFIGTVDGKLLQLTVAFQGTQVAAYTLASLN